MADTAARACCDVVSALSKVTQQAAATASFPRRASADNASRTVSQLDLPRAASTARNASSASTPRDPSSHTEGGGSSAPSFATLRAAAAISRSSAITPLAVSRSRAITEPTSDDTHDDGIVAFNALVALAESQNRSHRIPCVLHIVSKSKKQGRATAPTPASCTRTLRAERPPRRPTARVARSRGFRERDTPTPLATVRN
mmetsp:Transcript_19200/g.61764  ORF Transcript_19200/g.61764 Transcript_19200/m.61764 type:complete len:200 (-) Transcript_19200:1699-2298(-)